MYNTIKNKLRIFYISSICGLFLANSNFVLANDYKENFTNIYSFGDSFSGEGTWTENFAKHYGISFIRNQNIFAIGNTPSSDLINQLATYSANVSGFDKNAIYYVYDGPSDMADHQNGPNSLRIRIFLSANALGISQFILANDLLNGSRDINTIAPQSVADINARGANIANFVETISSQGAGYVVVFNHFNDFYRTNTISVGQDPANNFANGKLFTYLYNQAIYGNINSIAPKANVVYVDYDRLVEEVASHPNDYFTPGQINGTYNNNGFFDLTVHPTPTAHELTKNYVLSVLEAPSRVALVRELPIANGNLVIKETASLANDRANFASNEVKVFNITPEPLYQYSNSPKFSKKQLGLGETHTIAPLLVANYGISEEIAVGGQLHYFRNNSTFVKKHGKSVVQSPVISLYSLYNNTSNNIFGYVTAGYGDIRYEIDRNITLGIKKTTERGKTKGKQYIAGAGIGYNYFLKGATISPFFDVNYQNVSLKDYRENYTRQGEFERITATTMSFKVPNRESITAQIGTKLATEVIVSNMPIKPMLSVSYIHEFKDNLKKRAEGKVSDMPRYFAVPTYKVAQDSFNITGSLSTNINQKVIIDLTIGGNPLNNISKFNAGLSAKIKL